MLNNYFIIKEVAEFLNKNIGGYLIKEIYSQVKNKILFELVNSNTSDSKVLEFSIERDYNYLLVKNNFSKAKKNYAVIFEEIYGKDIVKVKLYNNDRAVSVKLSDEFEIIFTFFTNKANCFLINNSKVINSFKDRDENINTEIDEIIPQRGKTEVEAMMNVPLKKYLKLNYRNCPETYIQEAMYRANLSPEISVDEHYLLKIRNEIDKIEHQLKEPGYYLYSKGNEFNPSLIHLSHRSGNELNEFDDINQLLTEFVKLKFSSEKTEKLKSSKSNELEKKISNVSKKLEGIKTQLKHCEDSNALRKTGDILLQNLGNIKKGDKNFSFRDENKNEISIKLKENLSAVENAQNYFDKYKKQKSSVNTLKSKITNLERDKIRFEFELKDIKEMSDMKKLIKEEKRSEENKKDETSRFRKFGLNDKYEVWVGKDSLSNDMLTTKYASPNDLWFHVRGASGSHTVLKVTNKKEDVPKESILAAASIAAYYSKARRGSNVPVAYCEKKYVKKKKGFKTGSVIMEREKVVFVKPSLPAEN